MPAQAAPRPLDEAGRRILSELIAYARLPVNELARRAGVSRATAYARSGRLLADRVITGFRAEVDPAVLGHSITALILLNVDQGDWSSVREQLVQLPGFFVLDEDRRLPGAAALEPAAAPG
jgi:DNA-binding Lrp family transcriptional regulator